MDMFSWWQSAHYNVVCKLVIGSNVDLSIFNDLKFDGLSTTLLGEGTWKFDHWQSK